MKGSLSEPFRDREVRLNELFRKVQAGDRAAYRTLLEELMEILTAYFKRSLGRYGERDSPQVADLVQETLLAIHEKRATFDPNELFGPWMFAIARYKTIDYFRKHTREKPAAEWEPLEATLITDDSSGEFATHEDLETLLSVLPEKQKALLRKLKLEGKSVKEVSAEFGMSETALKVNVHRAMKTLKLRLREEME